MKQMEDEKFLDCFSGKCDRSESFLLFFFLGFLRALAEPGRPAAAAAAASFVFQVLNSLKTLNPSS
jgi:hypothetical protein